MVVSDGTTNVSTRRVHRTACTDTRQVHTGDQARRKGRGGGGNAGHHQAHTTHTKEERKKKAQPKGAKEEEDILEQVGVGILWCGREGSGGRHCIAGCAGTWVAHGRAGKPAQSPPTKPHRTPAQHKPTIQKKTSIHTCTHTQPTITSAANSKNWTVGPQHTPTRTRTRAHPDTRAQGRGTLVTEMTTEKQKE